MGNILTKRKWKIDAQVRCLLDNHGLMKMIKQLLHKFGHQSFLPLQEEAIISIIEGKDLLLISPTGGGKSLVYQLAALRLEGVAVIVCPLLALMTQQVQKLKALGIKAEFLNSTLNPGEQDDLAFSLRNQSIDLLFLSPEKLLQPSVIGVLSHSNVAFFAIDEAHCIAQWGQGFRPEYGDLGMLRQQFDNVPIMAMSGSADVKTQETILSSLGLNQPAILQQSYNRANIEITISQKRLAKKQLIHFIATHGAGCSGIVYCRSRKKAQELSDWLNLEGYRSLFFHANISDLDKQQNVQQFAHENGIIMVATTAFGMGLDFDHVRFIVHMDLPNNLESYYQEVGRAGRDGKPAHALLLYGLQDMLGLLQFEREVNQSSLADWQSTLDFCRILEQRGCRRQNILAHFGEHIDACGNCDRCKGKHEEHNLTIAAQKFLSLLHKTKGLIPIGVLIQILLGKETKAVKQCEGRTFALFAKGQELDEVSWKALVRYLLANEYIAIFQFSPFQLVLQEKAKPLLKSQEQIVINLDYFVPNFKPQPIEGYKKQLLTWYNNEANQILSKKQLELVSLHKPKTLASLSRLTGVSISALEEIRVPLYPPAGLEAVC